jgi:hypothetical protein
LLIHLKVDPTERKLDNGRAPTRQLQKRERRACIGVFNEQGNMLATSGGTMLISAHAASNTSILDRGIAG